MILTVKRKVVTIFTISKMTSSDFQRIRIWVIDIIVVEVLRVERFDNPNVYIFGKSLYQLSYMYDKSLYHLLFIFGKSLLYPLYMHSKSFHQTLYMLASSYISHHKCLAALGNVCIMITDCLWKCAHWYFHIDYSQAHRKLRNEYFRIHEGICPHWQHCGRLWRRNLPQNDCSVPQDIDL